MNILSHKMSAESDIVFCFEFVCAGFFEHILSGEVVMSEVLEHIIHRVIECYDYLINHTLLV